MQPPWRRMWEVSLKSQYVYPTWCKQNGSLSTGCFQLLLHLVLYLWLSFNYSSKIFSPVTQIQNFSHDVNSARNNKTSCSHWTVCYNEWARGGRSWHRKPWHVMRQTIFIFQDTLLKFNESTYGPNIYNSEFSAAAVCPHCCYPHSHYLSQFFPLTRHISFLYIHRHHHHWATCWPVLISLHPKVSSVLFHGSFCFSVRSFSLRWETCYEAFCLHVVTNSLCNYVFCPNLALYPAVYHLCAFYLFYT